MTPEQADMVYTTLVAHAGVRDTTDDRYAFVFHAAQSKTPCEEYRFMGALGYGGKFRNNRNNGGIPYVDCYREDLNERRQKMISETNSALAALFAPPATEKE